MDYTKGYRAVFYAAIVDPISWTDGERFEIIEGSITRTDTDIRQTAELTCKGFPEIKERWIRIYMDAEQDGDTTHEPLFTGLCASPKNDITGTIVDNALECYSVLQPCADLKLERGWYLPKGTDSGAAIKKLLKGTRLVIDDGTPRLLEHLIAEDNESQLSMADKLLETIGWRMNISGDGTVYVKPKSEGAVITFSRDKADVVSESLTVSHDWFQCPNVVRATSGNQTAEVWDDDPDSELSIPSRGRKVMLLENDVTLSSDEGLYQYAKRRLEEEQKIAETLQYTRRYIPGINIGDTVGFSYPAVGGDYTVTKQTIDLTYSADTKEDVERVKPTTVIPFNHWFKLILPDDQGLIMPDGLTLLIRK